MTKVSTNWPVLKLNFYIVLLYGFTLHFLEFRLILLKPTYCTARIIQSCPNGASGTDRLETIARRHQLADLATRNPV